MSWARLDDRWHDHPKVIAAGLDGAGLFAMCLTWAHSVRRTSHTPGVVPDAVISRFAGRKAAALTKRLRDIGLFDERTDAGWPIHDFDDYLPRYDPDQAKAAGSAGGKARAANRKQTAKQTASEPPSDEAANPVAKPSTRASARRNPVPVTSEGLRPSDDADASPTDIAAFEVTAQTLVGEWVDMCGFQPDRAMKGQVSSALKRLIDDGVPTDQIREGLRTWHGKRLNPATLPSVVHGARLGPPEVAAGPDRPSTSDVRASAALAAGAEVQALFDQHSRGDAA